MYRLAKKKMLRCFFKEHGRRARDVDAPFEREAAWMHLATC